MDYKTNHIVGATECMPSDNLYISSYRDEKTALIIGDRTSEDFLVATVALEHAPDISPNVWRTGRKWATGFVYAEEAEVLPPLAADVGKFNRNK